MYAAVIGQLGDSGHKLRGETNTDYSEGKKEIKTDNWISQGGEWWQGKQGNDLIIYKSDIHVSVEKHLGVSQSDKLSVQSSVKVVQGARATTSGPTVSTHLPARWPTRLSADIKFIFGDIFRGPAEG